jgi:hypothetical protein
LLGLAYPITHRLLLKMSRNYHAIAVHRDCILTGCVARGKSETKSKSDDDVDEELGDSQILVVA